MSDELLVVDEQRHGIELVEIHGGPGYHEERLYLENGLSNGLRFLVLDDETLAHFHIHNPETAKLLAARLLEWADRIADPPNIDDSITSHKRNGAI